jgi:hypothetical protein
MASGFAFWRIMKQTLPVLLFITTALCAYVLGASSGLADTRSDNTFVGTHDGFDRLVEYPSKTEVACPPQTNDMGVLLAAGQSNAANSGEKKFTTAYPRNVFNYFNGKCFVAASPLLGAFGEDGEFLTPLADALISKDVYKSVIIVASAIGGTQIQRWQRDGDLSVMLLHTITGLQRRYHITDVIWHQGESDALNFTPTSNYIRSFLSLRSFLTEHHVIAPMFIAIATHCAQNNWTATNPVARAQRQLIDNKGVFLGADTDALLTDADRKSDGCHMSERGQIKTATTYAENIALFHSKR